MMSTTCIATDLREPRAMLIRQIDRGKPVTRCENLRTILALGSDQVHARCRHCTRAEECPELGTPFDLLWSVRPQHRD